MTYFIEEYNKSSETNQKTARGFLIAHFKRYKPDNQGSDMKKYLLISWLLAFISLCATEPKFLKSYEYIKSSDYNESIKYEMRQVVFITQAMFDENISNLVEKTLMGAQYSNCIKSHLSENDFFEFTHTIEEEVYKQNDLKTYKRNLISGGTRLAQFINSNVSDDLSFEELEKYYEEVYACEKLKKH